MERLEYFVKVAENLSFSKASKLLSISQSTLSQQIHLLEKEFDAKLFLRTTHSVALTEEGKALLPYARNTLMAANHCYDRVQDVKKLLVGELNIGATYSFSPILMETLISFTRQYPKIKLNIIYKPMSDLIEMLRSLSLDLVLAFKPTTTYRDIESHILFKNHLAAIVNSKHELAQSETLSINDLMKYEIALPSIGLQARNSIDSLFAHKVSHMNIRAEFNEVNILLKVVKESNLVTILAESTVQHEEGIKAIPINMIGNKMEGCIHILQNEYHKKSLLKFIDVLYESEAVDEKRHDWLDEYRDQPHKNYYYKPYQV